MKTMTQFKDKLTDAATQLGEGAGDVARNLQARAKDAWGTVQDQTKRAVHESAVFARKHPVSTALAVCGVGLVAGLLLKHSPQESFKDRYIVKPLHQSRGLLLGTLIACGTLFKRTFSADGHISHELKDAAKTVKRFVRKSA